jgi:hypothetical protein
VQRTWRSSCGCFPNGEEFRLFRHAFPFLRKTKPVVRRGGQRSFSPAK